MEKEKLKALITRLCNRRFHHSDSLCGGGIICMSSRLVSCSQRFAIYPRQFDVPLNWIRPVDIHQLSDRSTLFRLAVGSILSFQTHSMVFQMVRPLHPLTSYYLLLQLSG